jgi:putative NIF3 family GTP cyclohydrolase 1 type 2
VALCGGSGFFLLGEAIAAGADAYLTSDIKYHEFFDSEGKLMLMDLGHFESEQFTPELIFEELSIHFPNIAVLLSKTRTNPVFYA